MGFKYWDKNSRFLKILIALTLLVEAMRLPLWEILTLIAERTKRLLTAILQLWKVCRLLHRPQLCLIMNIRLNAVTILHARSKLRVVLQHIPLETSKLLVSLLRQSRMLALVTQTLSASNVKTQPGQQFNMTILSSNRRKIPFVKHLWEPKQSLTKVILMTLRLPVPLSWPTPIFSLIHILPNVRSPLAP